MPVHRPDDVATPAYLPCEMLWVSTNRMSGPGRIVRAAEAAIKYTNCDCSIKLSHSSFYILLFKKLLACL
jgi:hypothetical protein